MAKSPMAALLKQPLVKTTSSENADVTDISMSLSFKLKKDEVHNYNLRDFCHLECDPNNSLATPSRFDLVRKIYKKLSSSSLTDESKLNQVKSLKRYFFLCDRKSLNPFGRDGIDGILGMQGELARQEKLANEPMPFRFNYPDGAELGIKTSSANTFASHIKDLLAIAGCSSSLIEKYARRPNQRTDKGTTQPHTDGELENILSRVQPYFFSLADGISDYFDKHGEIPQRLSDLSIGVSGYEGETNELKISLGSRVDNTCISSHLPFNQMMISGYVLFCYYTSFNDTQVRDVRHPLSVITQRKEGRTERYVRVKGYKARKGSDVEAYFVGIDEGEFEDSEAKGKNAGFIVADFLKRGRHKHTDGLKFINKLSEVSRKCNPDQYGKLFYSVSSHGEIKKTFDVDGLMTALTFNLGLLSENRTVLSSYLSDVICRYLDKGEWERITTTTDSTGFKTISRKLTTEKMKSTRVSSLVYVFVRSLTDIPLKGALIPLTYKESKSKGDIEVFIKYEDGAERKFVTSTRFKNTLKKIEARSETLNPLKAKVGGREVTRPAYFLPMGVRSETYQWEGHEMPVRRKLLADLGINHGAYILNINSRRIRTKNSDNLYIDEDGGKFARDILQHSKETQGEKYVDGHPTGNMRQMSQGLSAMGHIADGDSVEVAKTKVRKQLGIKVLAYDEWKKSKTPSNPNGVACNGKIDLREGKNEHYAAQKFAEENGIINEGEDITCFQYDLCIFCKNMQLIDDVNSVYKLISFIDSLYDPIEKMPERADYLVRRIERFESLLELLPEETLEKADLLFEENGRYFLFN
ncbi:hypothetical protein F0223_11995 [Vibrio coralliilyticus]|uniref:hypothetical protein n=1 Tax=Vibrio coralliilyticus TaxID=190893 RepID=UPI00148CE3BA|nr:hypothetical protein [Vibrio coralliilyticus]NOI18954.1 hypothetical protein [Vibrio coralliilyticus]